MVTYNPVHFVHFKNPLSEVEPRRAKPAAHLSPQQAEKAASAEQLLGNSQGFECRSLIKEWRVCDSPPKLSAGLILELEGKLLSSQTAQSILFGCFCPSRCPQQVLCLLGSGPEQ